MTDEEKQKRMTDARLRYQAAMHAMQSGVAILMVKKDNIDHEKQPGNYIKHLRVGVNSAMVDTGAICGLLIEKGVVTEVEMLEALATYAEQERERYERAVRQAFGNDNITLG